MCRNIKKLRRPEGPPHHDELRDAALQFVRKISGYREPSRANRAAFDAAVDDVTRASRSLFEAMGFEVGPPRALTADSPEHV
jgi:hypothetical protein